MDTSMASRKSAPQSTSSMPQARPLSRSPASRTFVCEVIGRWWLVLAPWYQSVFILVPALPA